LNFAEKTHLPTLDFAQISQKQVYVVGIRGATPSGVPRE
jgi:hypothetical protein